MAVGGATWDTAGTLDLGSGNTSAVVGGAWWTFTVTEPASVTLAVGPGFGLDLYAGEEDPGTLVAFTQFEGDFDEGLRVFYLLAPDTYHLVVNRVGGHSNPYQVTYSSRLAAVTPWLELADNVNNEGLENSLVISRNGYDLQGINNRVDYQSWQDWMDDVIRRESLPGRVGAWGATEVLSSPHPPSEAVGCIWDHANWGEFGGQLWTDIAQQPSPPGDPVCLAKGSTANDGQSNLSVGYSLKDGEPPIGFVARTAEATSTMSGRAIYFYPVRENVGETGALLSPDPVADGVPEDAELEWESDYVALLGVDITGDSASRVDESAYPVDIGIHDVIQPIYDPVDRVYVGWQVGYPGEWDETGTGYQRISYVGGPTVDWEELDVAVTGDDGWASAADPEIDPPDTVAILGMEVCWVGTPDLADGVISNADLALRFRLQSPRYRWIYPGTQSSVHPRRVIGKDSPARVYPLGLTQGSAARVIGGAL